MKRVNVSDMIYDKIISDFLNNKIDFGEKLVETDYAEKLEVSRTPLREAIKKLEHDGIIIRLLNGRLKFLDFTKENLIELYNIRVALENMLIEQCINNKEILNELEENISLTETHISENNLALIRDDIKDFTKILYSSVEFSYTVKILNKNNLILTKIKNKSLTPQQRIHNAYIDHKNIYEAMKSKDLEKALSLNREHLLNSRNVLLETTQF